MASTSDIAHRWANQLFGKRDGTLSSKSTHCDETSFYSYSTVIAQWLDKERKIMAVLDMNLTPTTSKHLGDLRRAIPVGTTVFYFHRNTVGYYSNYPNVDVWNWKGELDPMSVTRIFIGLLRETFENVKATRELKCGDLHWWKELQRWAKWFPKASVNHYLKLKMPDKATYGGKTRYKEKQINRKMLRALLSGAAFEEVVDIVNGKGTWEAYLNRTKGVRKAAANRAKAEKICRYVGWGCLNDAPLTMRGVLDMTPLERVTRKLTIIDTPSKHEIQERKAKSANRFLKFLGIQGEYSINGWFSFSNDPKIVVDPVTGQEIYNSSFRRDWSLPTLSFRKSDMEAAMRNPEKYRAWFLAKARTIGKLHYGSRFTEETAVSDYAKECVAAYQEFKQKHDARQGARKARAEAERKQREAERLEKERKRQMVVDIYHAEGIDGYRKLWRERYDSYPHCDSFSQTEFYFGGNVLLRFNERTEMVETSKSITLSVSQAKKLWKVVTIWHQKPERFKRIEIPTKGATYTAHSYTNDILTAGCHSIAYSEMERMARQLNFIQ